MSRIRWTVRVGAGCHRWGVGLLVTVLGLVLAPPALATSQWFGNAGVSAGGPGCPTGQPCAYYSDGASQWTSPLTGSITEFKVAHDNQGGTQQAELLVLDAGTTYVEQVSAPCTLSAAAGTDDCKLASGIPITIGQALAVAVIPDASHQADGVGYASGANGDTTPCTGAPSGGSNLSGCNALAGSSFESIAVSAYVQDPVPAPTVDDTPGAASLTATSATLQANVNPNGQDTHVCFAYATTPSPAPCTPSSDIGTGSSSLATSQDITGLQPNTIYYYDLAATNFDAATGDGGPATGAVESFRTLPAPKPTVAPASPAVSGVGEHQATLAATVASNGFATSWYFQYGTDTGYGSRSAGGSVGSGSGATPQAVSDALTGLAPNTTYHYQLVATNAGGTSTTQDGTFTTLKGQPPVIGSSTSAGAANGDPTQETLSFAIGGDGYSTTYHVEYGTTASYGSASTETPSQSAAGSAPTDTAVLTGLQPSTTYHWRVVAKNQWGTTDGPEQTFTTPAPPVPFLSGFRITYLDSAAIYGEYVVNDRGWASTESVQYGPTTRYGSSVPVSSTLGYSLNDVIDFVIGNLRPATIYHWRVVATNQWGTTYGPDQTTVTLTADQLARLLDLLGSSSPRSAPTVQVALVHPVVVLGQFRCPPACNLSVSFAIPGKGRHGKATPLGTAKFRVAHGKHVKLGVRLSPKAARLLRARHRLRVTARYRITDQHGNTTTIIRTLTLKAKGGGARRRLARAAAGALAAGTGVRTGAYQGRTAQHLPISFRASPRGVQAIRFDIVASCRDGARLHMAVRVPPGLDPYERGHPGRFAEAGGPPAWIMSIRGTIRGSRASGTVSIIDAQINQHHRLDPVGRIHCRTGNLRWSARLRA